jgi:hypothetical protein
VPRDGSGREEDEREDDDREGREEGDPTGTRGGPAHTGASVPAAKSVVGWRARGAHTAARAGPGYPTASVAGSISRNARSYPS